MSKHDVVVELYYGGTWHNLTTAEEVYRSTIISTSRYGATQARKLDPGATKASLKSSDGKYNPENPLSPLYGLASRNTPMRITVDGLVRWTGEAAQWRPARSVENIRRTELTGGGILRRLGIGNSPAFSAIVSAALAMNPVVYFPFTDGALSTIAGSVISGVPGYPNLGSYTPATVDGPAGDTTKLPEFATSDQGLPAVTIFPSGDSTDTWTMEWVMRFVPNDSGLAIASPLVVETESASTLETTGNITVTVVHDPGSPLTSSIQLSYDAPTPMTTYANMDLMDGVWHQGKVRVSQSGGTATFSLYVDDGLVATDSGTWHPGSVTAVAVLSASNLTITSASLGHLTVIPGTPSSTYVAFGAHVGERAADRFERLCTERGVPVSIIGTPATDSQRMGRQPILPILELLYDCTVTDGGISYESVSGGLVLHSLGALYRQTPALVIDIDTDIVPPLDPIVGDRTIRNDVTAKRRGGSQARYELTTGPLSTQAPPNGVGRYDTQLEVNPESDESLLSYAGWFASTQCVEGVTYDKITLGLEENPNLDLSTLEIGTVVQLNGIPVYDDPETPLALVVGMEETTDTHRRTVTLLVTSAKPYQVGKLGTTGAAGYLDCGASTLNGTHAMRATTLTLAIADQCTWTHADGDYDVVVAGERVTVTGVGAPTGTSGAWAQTLTVVRGVNGVRKALPAGSAVHVADPFILAL